MKLAYGAFCAFKNTTSKRTLPFSYNIILFSTPSNCVSATRLSNVNFKYLFTIKCTCMRFENFSQNTLNYYLSNKFEMNKQMIREIREYINADPMNKDWIKNNLNKQHDKKYINTFLKLFSKYNLNKMRESVDSVRGGSLLMR